MQAGVQDVFDDVEPFAIGSLELVGTIGLWMYLPLWYIVNIRV